MYLIVTKLNINQQKIHDFMYLQTVNKRLE